MDSVPLDLRPPHIEDMGAVKTWSDPAFRARRPWTAILNYVGSVVMSIGEPFVMLPGAQSEKVQAWAVWQHQEIARYPIRTLPTRERVANTTKRDAVLSREVFKKLPAPVLYWVRDVQDKSDHVAWLLADVEGCINYLQKQIDARETLVNAIHQVQVPAPNEEMKRAVIQDSRHALEQLGKALTRAQEARSLLEPCVDFFLSKKSRTLPRDRNELIGLLVSHGGVTRYRAVRLVSELLPVINPRFERKSSSTHVSAHKSSKTAN